MAALLMRGYLRQRDAKGVGVMFSHVDDIDRIMSVMECAFPPEYGEAWNRRQVSDALIVGNCRYGIIGSDGSFDLQPGTDTAGFFMGRSILDEEELLLFAIAPQYRRRGLAHQLLSKFIEQSRANGMVRIFLEMRRDNPAGYLYAAHGFTQIGVRPSYYRTSTGSRIDAISQELVLRD